METVPQVTDSHLFTLLGKDMLFNVETLLFYEVSPVVRDIFQLMKPSRFHEQGVFCFKWHSLSGLLQYGLFFTVVTVSMVGTRLLALPWADKVGARYLFAAALGLLALSLPLLGLVRGQAPFFSLAVSLGAGWGLTSPLCNALMFQYSPWHCAVSTPII